MRNIRTASPSEGSFKIVASITFYIVFFFFTASRVPSQRLGGLIFCNSIIGFAIGLIVNFNVFACTHKLEIFRQAFISSVGVDLGITGNVCQKSPTSNINVLPKGLKFPHKSCNDRSSFRAIFCVPLCTRPKQ